MLSATCHCGAVRVSVDKHPESLTDCNCSICRRYGVLWAYYHEPEVHVNAPDGTTDDYVWGQKSQKFVRCKRCGCVMYWQSFVTQPGDDWMGVNARNFAPDELGDVPIKLLDGASF
jgi:hypothetical protein